MDPAVLVREAERLSELDIERDGIVERVANVSWRQGQNGDVRRHPMRWPRADGVFEPGVEKRAQLAAGNDQRASPADRFSFHDRRA